MELGLNYNRLTDITPLETLTRLRSLELSNNQLTDITPLATLTDLTWLALKSNRLTDITPLEKLTGLTELWLSGNRLTVAKLLRGQQRILRLDDHPANDPPLAVLEANGCRIFK
jgi:internalin A